MVFEGKPLKEPSGEAKAVFEGEPLKEPAGEAKAVFEGEPLKEPKDEPQAEPKIETAPVEPPKKTHRFRNFLLTSLVLGSVVYIGGSYYALENEVVHDLYVDFLPFGSDIIGKIEQQRFQSRFENITQIASIHAKHHPEAATSTVTKPPGGLESVAVTSAKAKVNESVDIPVKSTTPAKPATPSNVTSAVSSTEKKPAAAPSTTAGLPLIRIPNDIDPLVANSIHSLNNLISSVNESKHTKEHIDRITKEINSLTQSIRTLKEDYKAELASKLKTEEEKASRLVEAQYNELKTAVAAQEEKWSRDFHHEQQRLAENFNNRLQIEIATAKNTIFAAANNKLLSAHVKREQQFASEVEKRVAAEREGRLAKLTQLSKDLADIEELTVKAEKVIIESDNAAQLHISIARLKNALESNKPVALGPYIDAIKKTSGSDPLLSAALASLPASVYEEGVLTPSQLTAQFHLLEPEIRKASLLPPNAGVAGHLGSLIFSKLLWKKSGNATGDDVESILARAETALSEGRIVDAVGEVNTLKGWPKRLAHDWLTEGRKRSEVEFLVDVVAEEGKLWGLEL